MPRSQNPWRCAECGEGGLHRATADAHDRCTDSALLREDVLQVAERFPDVPLDRIAADLHVTIGDVERFLLLARARRRRIEARR